MEKPNIVMIVMDAVRANNMSVYGYKEKTTPMLEKMLPNSMFYKNPVSSAYWTLPSHASMFTGTYLSRHGLVLDGDVLSGAFTTMAEILRAKGYVTAGICTNPYVSNFSGLDRGFDLFYDYRSHSPKMTLFRALFRTINPRARLLNKMISKLTQTRNNESEQSHIIDFLQKRQKNTWRKMGDCLQGSGPLRKALWFFTGFFDKGAQNTNNLAFSAIKKVKKRPFFIFMHYNETHTPYLIPRVFKEKFLTFKLAKKPWNINQDHLKYYSHELEMGKSDFRVLEAIYNGAISYLDKRIYEIYSFLEEEELLDNTLIIITSDHGDNLGEHGLMFHVFCLYDTLIKIPMIIKYPADLNLSGIENQVVQNTDLLPTIMDILGVKDKHLLEQIQGNSLVTSNIENRSTSYGISELVKPFGPSMSPLRNLLKKHDRRLISIRTDDKKYIYSSDSRHEFYDLKKDPDEVNNLIDCEDASISTLSEELKPWLAAFNEFYEKNLWKIEKGAKIRLEADIEQRLKDLGYL